MKTERSGSKANTKTHYSADSKKKNFKASCSCRVAKHAGSPFWYYLILILIILLFAYIRFRLKEFPLERDEGEYAYAGQLILQGIPPYELAYSMKFPGTYVAYAAILAIFGQTAGAVHCGVLVLNAATIFLVYLLGARLFNRLAGVIAGAVYALLSTSPSVLGIAGHATHFVVFPALAGILLLLRALEKEGKWLFVMSGALLGLAFLMKQHGIFFLIFAALYLLTCELRKSPRDLKAMAVKEGALVFGAFVPLILTCLILLRAGVFGKFWFWTVDYAREYASTESISSGIYVLRDAIPSVTGHSALLWLIAALGPIAFFWDSRIRSSAGFVIGFAVSSFLAICPGFYFRPHYFILLIPAAALSAGLAVSSASQYFQRKSTFLGKVPILIFLLGFFYSVARQSTFFLKTSPTQACREIYGSGPFPESLGIAQYLKSHAAKGTRIAVLGSEPQIYFYSGLRSATGYIYTYGLMEEQKYALQMQKEMISEIEAVKPEYVVFVYIRTSWHPRPHSENLIFTWANRYLENQYNLNGIVDIFISGESEYRWGAEAASYQPRSNRFISIFKRKQRDEFAVSNPLQDSSTVRVGAQEPSTW
jgi:hypothetical protein